MERRRPALSGAAKTAKIITAKKQIPSDDTGFSLDSGILSLAFTRCDKCLRLTGLTRVDGCAWLGGAGGDLWRLELISPNGRKIEIGSETAMATDVGAGLSRLEVRWSFRIDGRSGSVEMTVRLEEGASLSYWSLEASPPEGWNVMRADFPMIGNVRLQENLKLAAPNGWGLEYTVGPGTDYDAVYPSCQAVMQFMALYNGKEGLYIGAHDPAAHHKRLQARAGPDGASVAFVYYAALPKEPGRFTVPFETAIGVFTGGYYAAAQVYRAFTFTAPWGKAGPVSGRPIPRWVKETDLWLRPDGNAEDNVEITKRALKYFGVRTSCHWYRWHRIPYDTLYPEYFPPLPGFREGIASLQEEGTHVMPYINGRLCDPNSTTWNDEGANRWAAKQANGDPYTEVYGSKVPLNVMCPYTDEWQAKVRGLVDRLIRECGVDGVYIDQIAAAHPVRCFDPDHGHAMGGGTFWVQGYRKMLEGIRALLPEGKMITTEENAECWIDQFDALLIVNTHTDHPPIPLFPAVYSGRTISFGFMYLPDDDLARSLPFRVKMARAFLWGAQPGWIQPFRIMAPEAAEEAGFLRDLARCRRFGHDFLVYGRFLGLLETRGAFARLQGIATGSFGGEYAIDVPAVMASAWLSETGDLGVALCNLSDEARVVEVDLPFGKADIDPSGDLLCRVYRSEGPFGAPVAAAPVQKVRLEPRSAAILAVGPKRQ